MSRLVQIGSHVVINLNAVTYVFFGTDSFEQPFARVYLRDGRDLQLAGSDYRSFRAVIDAISDTPVALSRLGERYAPASLTGVAVEDDDGDE